MPKKHGFHRIIYFCHMSFGSTHPSDEELLVLNGCFGAVIFPMPGSTWGSFMVFLSVLEILGCLAFSLIMTLYTEIPKVYSEAPKIISKIFISISRLGWKKPSRPHMHVGYMLSSPRLWSFPRTWQTFFERCWNMLEYWKWWTMTESEGRHIFSMVFKGRFFWDHHFPSRIRSEKHHIDFCKNEICINQSSQNLSSNATKNCPRSLNLYIPTT